MQGWGWYPLTIFLCANGKFAIKQVDSNQTNVTVCFIYFFHQIPSEQHSLAPSHRGMVSNQNMFLIVLRLFYDNNKYCNIASAFYKLKVSLVILLRLTNKLCQPRIPRPKNSVLVFFLLRNSPHTQIRYTCNCLRACLAVLSIRVCTLQMN